MLDKLATSIAESLSIDPEKDLLENLSGSINLFAYDGKTINLTNYNTVLTLGVKDLEKIKQTLKKPYRNLSQKGSVIYAQ